MKITANFRQSLAILGLSLAIQTAFLLILPGRYRKNEDIDYLTFYKPVGESILAGEGFVGANGTFDGTYPPGYPIILAFVFGAANLTCLEKDIAIDVFDIMMMAGSAVLLFWITRTLFGQLAALITFFLWTSYPANLWLIKQPNSEIPFIFCLLLSIVFFVLTVKLRKLRFTVLCGVLIGIAALVRPIAVFLPVVFLITAMAFPSIPRRSRAMIALYITLGFCVAVLPWELKLHSETGQFALLSTNGPSSMSEGLVFGVESIPNSRPMWIPADLASLMQRAAFERPTMRTIRSMFQFLVREARTNPFGVIQLAWMKLSRPWYATYSRRYDKLNLLYQTFYLPLGIAGLVYGIRRNQVRSHWIIFFVGVILYFWGMTILVVPLFRYMVPPMAFVIIFSSFLGEPIISRLFHRTTVDSKLPWVV